MNADEPFSFRPNNRQLVDQVLRAKIDGTIDKLAYFVDADVCSARPEELVRAHHMPARVDTRDAGDGKQWYFFSPARFVGNTLKRRSRTIDGTGEKESWHAEGSPKPVDGSADGGYMTKLSYHVKIGPKLIDKPGWIMTEYTFKNTRPGDTVLCKVYKSPRGPGRSCKRKAADDLEGANPSMRQRQTNNDDLTMLFAENIVERNQQSVQEHAAAALKLGDSQNVQQMQPELVDIRVPASFDGDVTDTLNWNNVENEVTILQAMGEKNLEAFHKRFCGPLLDVIEQQGAAVQSVQEHMTAPEIVHIEEIQPAPQFAPPSFDGDRCCSQKPVMAEEEQNEMTLLIPDGGNPEAYFTGLMFGDNKAQDGNAIAPPLTVEVSQEDAAAPEFGDSQDLPEMTVLNWVKNGATTLQVSDSEDFEAYCNCSRLWPGSIEQKQKDTAVQSTQQAPQFAPRSFDGDRCCSQKPVMAEEERDGMTLLIPDGGNPEAYFTGLMFGDNKAQDGNAIAPLTVGVFQEHAAAPEFGDSQNLEEGWPEPPLVSEMTVLNWVKNGVTTLQIPHSEDFEAYSIEQLDTVQPIQPAPQFVPHLEEEQQEEATVQTI